MIKTQQKSDIDNGFVVSRQFIYEKGYTMNSVCVALAIHYGRRISAASIRRICRGEAGVSAELAAKVSEEIKALPKVIVC